MSDDKKPKEAPDADRKTIAELAILTKNARPRGAHGGGLRTRCQGSRLVEVVADGRREMLEPSWQHAAAAALHGWGRHDPSDPLRMSLTDYMAAISAASAPPKGSRRLVPHGPACSPYLATRGDK